jgi:SPP1 family predicted phage head-tail adaptor
MAVTSSGRRIHLIALQNPDGAPVPTGDGEYTQEYKTFAEVFASIDPATAQKLERFASSVPVASATHIVVVPFQQNVTTLTRVKYGKRVFHIVGYADPEERHIELVLVCNEEVK